MATKKHKHGSAGSQPQFNKDGSARAKYDEAKHKRSAGGQFASKPGAAQASAGAGGKKPNGVGSVGAAHNIFDKMKGQPKKEMLAAAAAAGINPNTAKTQLYHWQKKQAAAELAKMKPLDTPEATLQAAAAKAIGVPPAPKPQPAPAGLKKTHPHYSSAQDALQEAGYEKTDKLNIFKNPSTGEEKLLKWHGGKNWEIQDIAPAPAPAPRPQSEQQKEAGYVAKHKADVDEVLAGTGDYEKKLAELNNTTITHIGLAKDDASKAKIAALHNESVAKLKAAQPKPAPPPPVGGPSEKPDLAKLGPTKYVHALADSMPGKSKKEVIAEAVKAGVNKSTAGVQYGKWEKLKSGEGFQLKTSPEPKALQAVPANKMSDKQLNEALESYHGKVAYQDESQKLAPQPYNSKHDYHANEGDKALTAVLGDGDVATQANSGKTFFKDSKGHVFEHAKGAPAGAMKPLTGGHGEYHYDPATKIVYQKQGGVLSPVKTKVPIFKSDQPYNAMGSHALSKTPWVTTSGVHDPDVDIRYNASAMKHAKTVHAAAGLKYVKNSDSPALKSYTHSGYTVMNGALRKKKDAIDLNKDLGPQYAKYVRDIDDEIASSSFKEDTILWRGVGHPETEWNGSPPPDVLTDHAFVSNSFNPEVAKDFSNGKTMFRVRVPKDFPALNVSISGASSGAASLSSEAEVMLPRGTTFRVVARHPKATKKGKHGKAFSMDVVDIEPVLPAWYVAKYGKPAGLA